MKHFDENGNFIESLPEEETEIDLGNDSEAKVNYIFKKSKDESL